MKNDNPIAIFGPVDNDKGCDTIKLSETLKVTSGQNKKRFFRLAFYGLFFLVAAIILITYYGQNVGNFVIQIDRDSTYAGLRLSDSLDFRNTSTRLYAEPLQNVINLTRDDILEKDIQQDGSGNGKNYICYNFYVKNLILPNVKAEVIAYKMTFVVTLSEKNVDKAVRIEIKQSNPFDDSFQKTTIYALDSTETRNSETNALVYTTVPFLNSDVVCSEVVSNFQVEQVIKYRVLIWLEGHDPECTDDILGGSIKFKMNFEIENNK